MLRKRLVAISIAQNRISDAIDKLVKYLETYVSIPTAVAVLTLTVLCDGQACHVTGAQIPARRRGVDTAG